MQIEFLVKSTNDADGATIVTLQLDCAQQSISDFGTIMNDNITLMDYRKGDLDPSIDVSVQEALLTLLPRKQTTILTLITEVTAAGYYCFVREADGSMLSIVLTLATPTFTKTSDITDAAITMAWAAVTNPTNSLVGYVVDRATNAGFTEGVAEGVYEGLDLTFTDTELIAHTHYYYRIVAIADGYNQSEYGYINACTLVTPGP